MKILLVPWLLLLFGTSLSSGHYIRDPEYGTSKVYQVREETPGVTFVIPKPDQPTLREILYYHIIERPREEPAVTNSHGYQFIEPESLSDEHDEKEHEIEHENDHEHMKHENESIEDKDTETREEEEPEITMEAKPLTDEDVKEAYKSRSYLFDQMRQRYAVKRMTVPVSLNRKKRQAEMQPLPEAPSFSNKDAYVLPKTYGINLSPEGGYVWNNLNKPPSYYELGPSNGNSNEGQYPTVQSQENIPLPSENAYIPPETSNSGSYKPILGSDEAVPSEGFANNPIGSEVASDSGANDPVEPVRGNDEAPQPEIPISDGSAGPVGESNENPAYGYGQSGIEEPKVESSPEESSEGEKIKEVPEAPTLPPLNYDNLPDYIRYAISTTEKPNLNKPPSDYELGPSNGNSNEGQYPTVQSQENIPLPSENAYRPPETSNSGSYRPILGSDEAVPSEDFANNPIGPEVASGSGANYPVEPVRGNDEAESNEGTVNNPGPELYENPEQSYPVEPIVDNSGLNESLNAQEAEVPQPETPISDGSADPVGESNENPAYGYGQSEIEEPKVESSPEESSEGEKIKEVPEAPTLPPLNYDSLPDYIRDTISSTEKPNLNKPPSYYELGPSNGNSNEGQYPTVQSQENIPLPSENAYIPPETSNSGSSEDIYVNTNRPSAIPLETQPEPANPEVIDNPELVNNNPVKSDGANFPVEPILGSDEAVPSKDFANNPIGPEVASDSGANYPVEPVRGNDEAESNEGIANNPIGPEVYENPEQSYPVEPIVDNSGLNESPNTQEAEVLQPETPISDGSAEPVGESNENAAYGYGQSEREEPKVESSPEEISEGEKIKEMPEATTLPPLNYDNLPEYIRDAILSTEKPASYEQTDNPYINPQPSPDDKKAMKDKIEDIFATMPPVEDIPKTYGMNLTSGGGHVWNDMVNPPVSYDVGTPSNPDEEHKEEQMQPPIIEQPEIHNEPENPIPKPAQPATEVPIANPEEPNQEPETHESEETVYPIEEPNPPPEPENEGELEEPIANPNQELSESEQEPEPETPEIEDKPIEEPTEPEVIPGNPELIPENPEVIPENPEVIPGNPELIPENPEVIPENPEVIPEPGNEDNHEIEVTEQPGDVEEPGDGDHLQEPENEPVQEIPEGENNKPDIMSELLKSEQFWKWLGEWTATYMEQLEKHIRKIVIQEICKREKSGVQMCPLDDKPEDTGVIIKDGKVIVDSREIDMTHTDNLDSELKRHQNNKHENNKVTNENKIEASTIYGNSVGNEKVTNVFIFTADKAEEVIDKLKPANDSEVDFVIDDRIKEEDKGEPNNEKSIEDESNVEEANKESNEGVNKEEPNNEESDKESNEGEATSEVIKEGSNEGEANKESNVPEANTEELNSKAKKESIEGEAAKEELDKEESTESDVSEANKEDAKIESKERVNEEDSTTTKNIDIKPETDKEDLKKDEESKGSGDIGELDDDESMQESSEQNTSDSKEYSENK